MYSKPRNYKKYQYVNNLHILRRTVRRIGKNALGALTLMIAESAPKDKDTITKVIVNLINKEN
jgi:hypothetical protein